jgi:POT family proton-dependent oligopeptide transporter
MLVADRVGEIPASWFQSINPVFILLFGLLFTALWSYLGKRRLEPSTPVKFALGLIQLGLGFGAFWYGAHVADSRGMVAVSWLFIGYLLQTTGELCISPVGLSMVTRMAPAFLVSTVMGMWFLATAFSQFLAAIIAQFTGVGHGGEGTSAVPVPSETLHVYGDVFHTIAITAVGSGVLCLILAPILKRWMHESPADLRASASH